MDALILGVDHDYRWRGVVLHREVEDLGASLARGHGADADVIAAAPAAGGDHVPGRRLQAQLDAKLVGHRLGHVDVETVELVLLIEEGKRWITFHQHVDQLFAGFHAVQSGTGEGLGGSGQGQQARAQQGGKSHENHRKKL